jgi:hypothetical protein
MRVVIGVVAGVGLTLLLLWFVLGGANVWRRAVSTPPAPRGPVRIQFLHPPKDGGAAASGVARDAGVD